MWDKIHLVGDPGIDDWDEMAAVLAPLFEDEHGDVRAVLIKRPDTMPTHAGHIAFPGGRSDPGDNGPVDTALRETHEEVGIEPERVEVLGFLPSVDTRELKPWVVPVVGRIRRPLNLVPSPREVVRVHTPRLADLADPERWWHVPWEGRRIWYYDLDGDTLWGATAGMVRSLLGMS
jgi:8-oxo-dGTP pyrophosphatase MutT (NUDIX family)